MRAYKFRIYPNKEQEGILEETLRTCRHLYNNTLAERKAMWESRGISITYNMQQNTLPERKENNPYLEQVHSQVLQDVLRRVDKAYRAFFRRVKNGEKAGYPRFKSFNRYDSFTYPQYPSGVVLKDGKLHLSKIGDLRIFLHRPIEGAIKICTIRKDVDKWYACFSAEIPDVAVEKKEPKNAIGVDVGLENLITLSNGEKIEPPKFLRKSEIKLAVEQRRLSRKKKGSKNRAKQRMKVARLHRKIREQRTDFNHKLSRTLVSRFDYIAFENLHIKNMMQNHYLAKSISDASWSQLMSFTRYKAEDAGVGVEFVDAKNTSQICSECGHVVPKSLAIRTHNCPFCGLAADRDVNAARNILMRTVGQTDRACGVMQICTR